MAIALGHLYHDDIDMAESDVVHVLAAAKCLHFQQLIHGYVLLPYNNVAGVIVECNT